MSEVSYELPEDIAKEFRVEDDGKVFAKSARAVARLCGCSDSSIRLLLEKVASAEPSGDSLTKPLKPFAGQNFKVSGEYSDILIAACVKHFAIHAQVTNQIAIRNDDLFSAVGSRTCLQLGLGWKQKDVEQISAKDVMSMFNQLATEIASMKSQLSSISNTSDRFPVINVLNQQVNNNIVYLPAGFREPFTLREWVKITKGVELTKSECMSFGRYATSSATTLKQRAQTKSFDGMSSYLISDMPALEAAWRGWKAERRAKGRS